MLQTLTDELARSLEPTQTLFTPSAAGVLGDNTQHRLWRQAMIFAAHIDVDFCSSIDTKSRTQSLTRHVDLVRQHQIHPRGNLTTLAVAADHLLELELELLDFFGGDLSASAMAVKCLQRKKANIPKPSLTSIRHNNKPRMDCKMVPTFSNLL